MQRLQIAVKIHEPARGPVVAALRLAFRQKRHFEESEKRMVISEQAIELIGCLEEKLNGGLRFHERQADFPFECQALDLSQGRRPADGINVALKQSLGVGEVWSCGLQRRRDHNHCRQHSQSPPKAPTHPLGVVRYHVRSSRSDSWARTPIPQRYNPRITKSACLFSLR